MGRPRAGARAPRPRRWPWRALLCAVLIVGGLLGVGGGALWLVAREAIGGPVEEARLARAIRINAVCPGYIETPMMDRFTRDTPEGRAKVIAEEPVGPMGKPEEIPAAVLWLCSEPAAFVIGHALVMYGGQTVQ
jgi:NAD(P)-dependent dehydrogenase (short-subunit alcohol dehydrogenase family)